MGKAPRWPGRFVRFLSAAGAIGISLMTGGAISFAMAAWEHVNGKSLPSFVWASVASALFLFGTFLAWSKEEEAKVQALSKLSTQRPKLQFAVSRSPSSQWWQLDSIDGSVFAIHHLGGDAAQFIKVSSIDSCRSKSLAIAFEPEEFLNSSSRISAQLKYKIISKTIGDITKTFNDHSSLSNVFFEREAQEQEMSVSYLVQVDFLWNNSHENELFNLTWNTRTKTLSVTTRG